MAISSENQVCNTKLDNTNALKSQVMRSSSMNADTALYMHQLEAIVACHQSDGYLQKWAQDILKEMQYQIESVAPPAKTLVAVK